jgi:hypothetical protein
LRRIAASIGPPCCPFPEVIHNYTNFRRQFWIFDFGLKANTELILDFRFSILDHRRRPRRLILDFGLKAESDSLFGPRAGDKIAIQSHERVGPVEQKMEQKMELPVLNNSAAPRAGMNRRQMVQRLAGAVGAGMAIPGVAAAHPVHKHLSSEATLAAADEKAATADWAPEFLDPHQNATLIVLAERIVPGSTGAQVNRFVDLLLTVDTQENQKKFLASLSTFEAEAITRHRQPFKDLTEDQQNAILTTASTEKPGQESGADSSSVPPKDGAEEVRMTLRDHFENMKTWVSGAYYSSEHGIKELGWTGQVMWDSYPGCQHSEGHR